MFENVAVSNAEVRRLAWNLENLKIVRLGCFQNNVDELVNGNTEKNLPVISA